MMLSYKTITTTKEYENFCKENKNITKLQDKKLLVVLLLIVIELDKLPKVSSHL